MQKGRADDEVVEMGLGQRGDKGMLEGGGVDHSMDGSEPGGGRNDFRIDIPIPSQQEEVPKGGNDIGKLSKLLEILSGESDGVSEVDSADEYSKAP